MNLLINYVSRNKQLVKKNCDIIILIHGYRQATLQTKNIM